MDTEVKRALVDLIKAWTPINTMNVTSLINEWTHAAVAVQNAARAIEDAAKAKTAAAKDRT